MEIEGIQTKGVGERERERVQEDFHVYHRRK
jgi:hypothetical protein